MTRGRQVPLVIPSTPPEVVVYDEPQNCPYLDGMTAVLPLRVPTRMLRASEFDQRLEQGDRRQGMFLYRTACPSCRACEPIRLDVETFRASRTQRRTLLRGDAELRLEIGAPLADERRIELYNLHKEQRKLGENQSRIDLDGYREFLVMTCCDSFEMRYYRGSELCSVALVDRGSVSLSAVYCYYDPSRPGLSLGTYSILKQIELCKSWGLRYLYLGLYIAECDRMRYKAAFAPHQRLIDGAWVEFASGGATGGR
ncbi:MAG TPA: arginyltransferase [Polyangiaceae bacterium]|nr:arginyltransferase [Polyangiaceae bacterium]